MVGYSDHTIDDVASIYAINSGAQLIEKHVCLDNVRSVDFFSLRKRI